MSRPARFAMKSKAIFDVSLSVGARLLYAALDDLGGQYGTIARKQAALAAMVAVTDREVRYSITELSEAGYVHVKRESHGLLLTLGWVKSDRNRCSDESPSDRNRHSDLIGTGVPITTLYGSQGSSPRTNVYFTRCGCGNPHDGTHPRKCDCGRVHYPETAISEDAVPAVVGMLHGFIRQAGLPWDEPDLEIAAQVLESAGGVAALWYRLRELARGRQKPTKNYAWFVAVVGRRKAAIA